MTTNRMKNRQHKVNFLTIFSSFFTFFHLFFSKKRNKTLSSIGFIWNQPKHVITFSNKRNIVRTQLYNGSKRDLSSAELFQSTVE